MGLPTILGMCCCPAVNHQIFFLGDLLYVGYLLVNALELPYCSDCSMCRIGVMSCWCCGGLAELVVAVVVGERWSLSGRCSTSVHGSWAVVDTTDVASWYASLLVLFASLK